MTVYHWLGAGIALAFYLQLGWTWAEVYGRVFCARRLTRRRQAGLILFWPVSMMLAGDGPE